MGFSECRYHLELNCYFIWTIQGGDKHPAGQQSLVNNYARWSVHVNGFAHLSRAKIIHVFVGGLYGSRSCKVCADSVPCDFGYGSRQHIQLARTCTIR